MNVHVVDLAEYSERGVGVLAGRDRGEFVRTKERLAELDADADAHIRVIIPDWIFSINSSFILGMLANSVRALTPEVFRSRYTFEGPNHERIKEELIRKAMMVGTPLARRTA